MLPRCLLQAARGLEPFDLELARRAYLTAWGAAITANHLGERASSSRSAGRSGRFHPCPRLRIHSTWCLKGSPC